MQDMHSWLMLMLTNYMRLTKRQESGTAMHVSIAHMPWTYHSPSSAAVALLQPCWIVITAAHYVEVHMSELSVLCSCFVFVPGLWVIAVPVGCNMHIKSMCSIASQSLYAVPLYAL